MIVIMYHDRGNLHHVSSIHELATKSRQKKGTTRVPVMTAGAVRSETVYSCRMQVDSASTRQLAEILVRSASFRAMRSEISRNRL